MSGFGGSLLSALLIQYGISVGASGALFGLLGSMLSDLTSNWTMYVNKLAALLTLLFIIMINLAVGILPHVDNFANIGGFVSGFLLGLLFLIRPRFKWLTQRSAPSGRVTTPVKSKHKTYKYVLWVLSLILLALVYEYMEKASLEKWLHPPTDIEEASLEKWLHPPTDIEEAREAPKSLNLLKWLSIAIDVACALD